MDNQLSGKKGYSRGSRSTGPGIHLRVSLSDTYGATVPNRNFSIVELTAIQLISFAMYNLCKHPEYLKPLRDGNLKSGGVLFNHQNNELPLLNSFMKETARMNPITICTIPFCPSTIRNIPLCLAEVPD